MNGKNVQKAVVGMVMAGIISMAGVIVKAQSPSTPITVGTATCGQWFNCYSVPITIGGVAGSMWMYPQGQSGWIAFRPPLQGNNGPDAVFATVTSNTINSRNAIGQPTQATITYTITNPPYLDLGAPADPDSNGDDDVVMGSFTINMHYKFHNGRGAGWTQYIDGGSGAQSITQD